MAIKDLFKGDYKILSATSASGSIERFFLVLLSLLRAFSNLCWARSCAIVGSVWTWIVLGSRVRRRWGLFKFRGACERFWPDNTGGTGAVGA